MSCPKSKQNSQYTLWVLVHAVPVGPGDGGTKMTLLSLQSCSQRRQTVMRPMTGV